MTTEFSLVEKKLKDEEYPYAVGHRILIKIMEVADKTSKGIYLPGKAVEDHRSVASIGKIVQMGEDAYNRDDMTKPWAKVGNYVMFGKYAGHRFKYGDAELRIMNDDERRRRRNY
mgnify:FL=1